MPTSLTGALQFPNSVTFRFCQHTLFSWPLGRKCAFGATRFLDKSSINLANLLSKLLSKCTRFALERKFESLTNPSSASSAVGQESRFGCVPDRAGARLGPQSLGPRVATVDSRQHTHGARACRFCAPGSACTTSGSAREEPTQTVPPTHIFFGATWT